MRLESRRKKLVELVMEGVPGTEVKDELIAMANRQTELAAQQTDDVEQREAARTGLRALITKIVIPPGDEVRRVFGNLGEMLATAASGRDVSTLAGVA